MTAVRVGTARGRVKLGLIFSSNGGGWNDRAPECSVFAAGSRDRAHRVASSDFKDNPGAAGQSLPFDLSDGWKRRIDEHAVKLTPSASLRGQNG